MHKSISPRLLLCCLFLFFSINNLFAAANSGSLLFVSTDDDDADIYILDMQSKEMENITGIPARYKNPVFYPDGKKIVFLMGKEGSWGVFRKTLQEPGVRPVNGTGPLDIPCCFTPDGKWLIVQSYREVNSEIFAINPETGEAVNLTNHPAGDREPTLSPDGKYMAFTSDRESGPGKANRHVFILQLATGKVKRLTGMNNNQSHPVYSPDGRHIAVSVNTGTYRSDAFVMNNDGSNPVRLSQQSPGWFMPEVWSEDGSRLVVLHTWYDEEKDREVNEALNYTLNLAQKSFTARKIDFSLADTAVDYAIYRKQKGAASLIRKSAGKKKGTVKPIAITNATVIDGTGSPPVTGQVILVKGGIITGIGPKKEVKIPAGALIISAKGKTVLPGFINSHVHRSYNASRLAVWAQAGITSVIDAGAEYYRFPLFDFKRNAGKHPEYAGILASGSGLCAEGGYSSGMYGMAVDGADDAAEKTRKLIDEGADIIKVFYENRYYDNLEYLPMLTEEELKAIITTAHRNERKVMAHVSIFEDKENKYLIRAIDAGIDVLAHNFYYTIPDAVIRKIVDRKIIMIPTLEVLGIDNFIVKDNLRRFVKAGGTVALGTDYGGSPVNNNMEPGMPMLEIYNYTQAGMTPLQVITAATKNAAAVCGREKELGTLETGKIADIIIVDGDPLKNIYDLKKVSTVIRNGVIIRNNR